MLTAAEFRHGLLDPHVKKQRVMLYGRGVYVAVTALESALRERDIALEDGELDRYVKRIGGYRIERGRLLRMLGLRAPRRSAQYFLPEITLQRVRQRQ